MSIHEDLVIAMHEVELADGYEPNRLPPIHPAAADPWDACAAVDPFTGQPDQHRHGDGCEIEGCE